MSDHRATFVCISTKKSPVKSQDQFLIRDMKNFNLEKILRTLENDLTAANLNSRPIESAQDAFVIGNVYCTFPVSDIKSLVHQQPIKMRFSH